MERRTVILRFDRRWLAAGLAVLLVGVLAPVAAVAAGGTFTDDDTSIFEADIEWLADAGVTRGCNPPANTLFCPEDPVTRGQMAAFMRRFAAFLGAEDGIVDAADTLDGLDSTAFVRRSEWVAPMAAFERAEEFPMQVGSADQVIVSLTMTPPVPGTVIVNSTVNAAEGAAGNSVACEITTATTIAPLYQQWWESGGGGGGSQAPLAGTRGFTVAGGTQFTVNLVCKHLGPNPPPAFSSRS